MVRWHESHKFCDCNIISLTISYTHTYLLLYGIFILFQLNKDFISKIVDNTSNASLQSWNKKVPCGISPNLTPKRIRTPLKLATVSLYLPNLFYVLNLILFIVLTCTKNIWRKSIENRRFWASSFEIK